MNAIRDGGRAEGEEAGSRKERQTEEAANEVMVVGLLAHRCKNNEREEDGDGEEKERKMQSNTHF